MGHHRAEKDQVRTREDVEGEVQFVCDRQEKRSDG
jgi:hypothetical protein